MPHDGVFDRERNVPSRVLGAGGDEDAAAAQSFDQGRSKVLAACFKQPCNMLRLLRGRQGGDEGEAPEGRRGRPQRDY